MESVSQTLDGEKEIAHQVELDAHSDSPDEAVTKEGS